MILFVSVAKIYIWSISFTLMTSCSFKFPERPKFDKILKIFKMFLLVLCIYLEWKGMSFEWNSRGAPPFPWNLFWATVKIYIFIYYIIYIIYFPQSTIFGRRNVKINMRPRNMWWGIIHKLYYLINYLIII